MKKIVEEIFRAIVYFMIGVGFAALGWNVFLCKLFPQLHVFHFKELLILTAGIDCMLTYFQMNIDRHIDMAVKGGKDEI